MNRRRQIPAGLFVLGAVLVLIALLADMDGSVETILYIGGGFFLLFGALMSWSNAGR